MSDDFNEFDIFERHAKEARDRRVEESKTQNAMLEAQEEKDAAEVAARTAAFSKRINDKIRLDEFEAWGVEPPFGTPVSIGMLFQFGWRVVELSGKRRLISPAPVEPPRARSDDRNT